MYFFKTHLLYPWAYTRQTEYIVKMTKEASTKIVNFITPWAEVLVQGRCHLSHIVKILPLLYC